MTATTAFLGHQALFGAVAEVTYGTTPSPTTIAALTNAFVFESETIKKHGNITYRDGLRGTRSHVGDDARVGPYAVSGAVAMQPNAVDLAYWLPFILGGATSSHITPLAETIGSNTLGFSRGPKKFRYPGAKVDRATFTGTQGGLLGMELAFEAQSEVIETTSWPSISADVTTPWIFSDLVFTINSVAVEIRDFTLTVDNALIKDRFMNSLTRVNIPEGDRIVTLRTTHAYATVPLALYDLGTSGYSGATLVLTNGLNVLTFTFGLLLAPAESPTAASRQENYLQFDWVATKTGSTMEIATTLTTS